MPEDVSLICGEALRYVNLIPRCFYIHMPQKVQFIRFLQMYRRFFQTILPSIHNFSVCCAIFSPLPYTYLLVCGEYYLLAWFT